MGNSFTKTSSSKTEVQDINENIGDKQVDRDQLYEFTNTIDAGILITAPNNGILTRSSVLPTPLQIVEKFEETLIIEATESKPHSHQMPL